MRTAAFFDIDHTLIAADTGILLMRYLLQRRQAQRHGWPIMLDSRPPEAPALGVRP